MGAKTKITARTMKIMKKTAKTMTRIVKITTKMEKTMKKTTKTMAKMTRTTTRTTKIPLIHLVVVLISGASLVKNKPIENHFKTPNFQQSTQKSENVNTAHIHHFCK